MAESFSFDVVSDFDRQIPEIKDQLERVMHLVEKSENDELPLPLASSLCNQEIITRCDQLICFAFHDSETLLNSCSCLLYTSPSPRD